MGIVDRGKKFGLSQYEVYLLRHILAWLNYYRFEIDGEEKSIATSHEPKLRDLYAKEWTDRDEAAYVNLRTAGIIETRWVAGRPCKWAPTEKFIDVVRHVFRNDEDVYPTWIQHAHPGAPLFGDVTELLTHRKGVLATDSLLDKAVSDSTTTLYPSVDPDHTPDLILQTDTGEVLTYVESLSAHHNREMCRDKFVEWHDETRVPVIWVFENREMMIETWNHIERRTGIALDKGEFGGDPANWHPNRVNSRLRRTRQQDGPYSSIDCVQTVGGILRADANDGRMLLQQNNIIS